MKPTRSRAAAARKDNKETVKPVEDRIIGKRKAAIRADKSNKKPAKNVKPAKKDPNKPKRPPTAFFVFLEEFRTIFKQEHPKVKAVSAVGKAGGEKWKSLSKAVLLKTFTVASLDLAIHQSHVRRYMEKAPYEAKAAKRKSEYEKLMAAYNKKQVSSDDEEEAESESSKSQVNDKDDEESEEDEEDEDEDEDDD